MKLEMDLLEDGDKCPNCEEGALEIKPTENCRCHIAPPCSACVDAPLYCPKCHYEDGDEVAPTHAAKPIEVVAGGLVCDNPDCDFTNDTPVEEYKNWINAACPECGQVLLTQQDYDAHLTIMNIVQRVNTDFAGKLPTSEDTVNMSIKVGEGKIEVSKHKIYNEPEHGGK